MNAIPAVLPIRLYLCAILFAALFADAISQVTVGGVTYPKDKFVVYIFVGHSNMNGRGTITTYFSQANSRAWNYNGGKWQAAINPILGTAYGGPTIPFVKTLADKKPGYCIGSIHSSGGAVTYYAPNYINTDPNNKVRNHLNPLGDKYTSAINAAKAVKANVTFGGVVCYMGWMEATYTASDGKPDAQYANRIKSDILEMMAAFRKDLGVPDLPLFITELEQPRKELWGPQDAIVRSAIKSLPSTDSRCSVISSSSLVYKTDETGTSDHHYSPASQITWAGRAVDDLIARKWFPEAPAGDTQPPTAPQNLSTKEILATSITLRWDAATDNVGVTGYLVFKGSNQQGTTGSGITEFKVSGLLPSTSYTFSVKAQDAAGNVSPASKALTDTTLKSADTVKPTVPSGLAASSIQETGVLLTWKASSDNVGIGGYEIFQNQSSIATVSGKTLTYQVSGLTGSTSYTFAVRATDSSGNTSNLSTPVTITTASPATPYTLISPNGGEIFSVGQTIRIKWTTDTTIVKGAVLYVSSNAGKNWTKIVSESSILVTQTDWQNWPWTIPPDLDGISAVSNQCIVRITDYDELYSDRCDNSFTIKPSSADVRMSAIACRRKAADAVTFVYTLNGARWPYSYRGLQTKAAIATGAVVLRGKATNKNSVGFGWDL